MLQAKTKEQQDYIKSLVEKESCDGDVTIYDDSINYRVDSCFDVDISFDTMSKIVDYLRMCEYQRKCGNIYQGRKQEEKTLPPINANWNFRKNK